ncbi:hypothetical protein TIFTF001_021908 [Ficus carica]|uniref:Uncharacterized protein n=1 Tax=Ficus carica TaxID=3494 RepID=A0AA88DCB6_FICCA|nr:hypothetical protein TIFTF001_021908 [Ficus carica]
MLESLMEEMRIWWWLDWPHWMPQSMLQSGQGIGIFLVEFSGIHTYDEIVATVVGSSAKGKCKCCGRG